MCRGTFSNGTRSWLLYNICFFTIIYAKCGFIYIKIAFGDKNGDPNSIWNPKKCVVLSWASFWMKLSIAPARVGLGITSYLSIKTLANSFQDGMPRVAYLKVIAYTMFSFDFRHHMIWFIMLRFLYVKIVGIGHLDDRMWYIHLCRFPWIHNGTIPFAQSWSESKM